MSVSTLVKSIQDIMRQDMGVDGDAQRISQLCWMFFLKIIDDQGVGGVVTEPRPSQTRACAFTHSVLRMSVSLTARRLIA